MVRSKAYLFKGVEIRWKCDSNLIKDNSKVPESETLHFPGGLNDFLILSLKGRNTLTPSPFTGSRDIANKAGRVEWSIGCLLYTSPSPRDVEESRMPSSA